MKKRARRTARSVRIRGLDDRRDVRMRGPAIDDEEAWDDQHSFFSILGAPNCHKKKNHTRARHRRTRVYTSSLIKSKFFSSLAKGDRRLLPLQRSLRRRPSNNFVTDSRAHLTRVQKRCAKHRGACVLQHPCIADLRHTLVRTRFVIRFPTNVALGPGARAERYTRRRGKFVPIQVTCILSDLRATLGIMSP